ncbi:MAG: cytochrome c oxidase subunit II [Actinomycetes bacterium]
MISTRPAGSARRRIAVAGLAGVVLLTATGCSVQDLPAQLSIPDPVTTSGDITYALWQEAWLALWVVGFFTWALILGGAFWFRRRHAEQVPAQTRYNLPIEVLYTITPLILIAGFFYPTARDEAQITKVTDDQDITINVVGYQWNWGFNYLDSNVYEAGTPQQQPTLYLPVNEKARFVLTSPDVIHSFWVPQFLFKMDVVPGRANQFELTPTKEGTYAGKCAEMCGTYHSQMLFWVKVVSPAEYEQHMTDLANSGQSGLLATGRANADAQNQGNTSIGQPGQSDFTNPLGVQQ